MDPSYATPANSTTPAITVTIATNDGWSALRQAYDPIREQAGKRPDVEVLLVDGSGGSPPLQGELTENTRWIEMPGSATAAKRLLTVLRRGEPPGRVIRVALPMVVLVWAQAIGELVGIFRGPGRSATKLH